MSTLKASAGLWLAVLGLVIFPLQAVADDTPVEETVGARLSRFFTGMEGDWDGEGTVQLLQNDGSIREHDFDIELDFDDQWEDDTWRARTRTTYDTGFHEVQDTWFSVRGDHLLAGGQFNKEPILVEEITPTRLQYSFDRVAYPARLHFTFTVDRLSENELRVHSAVLRNGVRVEERIWTVER